jgi:hypothetical protein
MKTKDKVPYQRLSTPTLAKIDPAVHDELHVNATRQAVRSFVRQTSCFNTNIDHVPKGQQATD